MKSFIQRFGEKVIGVLNGFDRLLIHGTLRRICYVVGMKDFLWHTGIWFKDFGAYAEETTNEIKKVTELMTEKSRRPLQYVKSSRENKEEIALAIARQDRVKSGLIAVLSCLETCTSYEVRGDRQRKEIDLAVRERKCLHFYHYLFDPEFGFMNARIQTWFPFNVQIYINGREWLARQMDRAGIKYERLDNSFAWIEDFRHAQRLMDHQLKMNWPKKMNEIAHRLNPIHDKIFAKYPLRYYWSVPQSEWASDLVFKDRACLAAIYPSLILHGITNFGSHDVMRFLSKKLDARFEGEVTSDFKVRSEGVRIKHKVGKNSVKLYDKFGRVLRVETTVNDSRALTTYRPRENHPQEGCVKTYLRRGVADIKRRADICQLANERYLDALAAVEPTASFGQLLEKICRPTLWNQKRIRALRPWTADDSNLLHAISRGEFLLTGFRNRDLQNLLYKTTPCDEKEKRRRSSRVSRLLKILRAHHLIRKVPSSYRYTVTPHGRDILNAILSTQKLTLEKIQSLIA
jgi:hypothetical protein